MATLDLGGSAARRDVNRELPLVPFIDFLLCIVAFLLVTAVWSEMARLDANAAVPGKPSSDPAETPMPELHVDMRSGNRFLIEWRQGGILLYRNEITKPEEHSSDRLQYPELGRAVEKTWLERGVHRAAGDTVHDRAVLHASNSASFEEVVAAMDAIAGTTRTHERGSGPAFTVTFAVD